MARLWEESVVHVCFTCITATDNPLTIIPCIISEDNPLTIIPCIISKDNIPPLPSALYDIYWYISVDCSLYFLWSRKQWLYTCGLPKRVLTCTYKECWWKITCVLNPTLTAGYLSEFSLEHIKSIGENNNLCFGS